MRIVAFSDTHGHHNDIQLPAGDLLVFAGDMCHYGSRYEVRQFNHWLAEQDFKYKLIVAGNHDAALSKYSNRIIEEDLLTDCIYLNDDEINVDGVGFYGSPYSVQFGDWAFMKPQEQMKDVWNKISVHTEVLITHSPPYDIMDYSIPYAMHCGCTALTQRLTELPDLRLHIFGHIHEGYGQMTARRMNPLTGLLEASIRYYNVSVCNERYELVNPVTVIELEV